MSVRARMEDLIETTRTHTGSDLTDIISARLDAAKKLISNAEHAIGKYKRNPAKYRPQLANLRQDAKQLQNVGRVIGTMLDRLEKRS